MRRILCVLVVGLFAVGLFAGIGSAQDVKSEINTQSLVMKNAYVSHAPIRINSDSDFDAQFPGRVISGYEINGTGYGYCIFIGNCSQVFTVKNCYLHNASGKDSIWYCNNTDLSLYKSNYGTITNNYCSETLWYGISLVYSNNNTITNNNAFRNGGSIYLESSNNSIIMNNKVFSSACGIWLESSNNDTITKNNASNNVYGIFLGSSSNTSLITNNNITSSTYYGIYVSWSFYNWIYHNNLINNNVGNGKQAYSYYCVNFWNTSTKGNYWFDQTSPDNDHNGIVDNPYLIDGGMGAKDYFPLVHPVALVPDPSPLPMILLGVVLLVGIISYMRRKID